MPRVKKTNKLMLWGFKSYKELDDFKKEAKKEEVKEEVVKKEVVKKEVKKEVKKDDKKVEREPFNLNENYGVDDLDFLNKEYDRIENILGKLDDFDKIEEYEELQDKLYELIEGLEMMKKMKGGVIKSTYKPFTGGAVKSTVKSTSKKPAKGSPEALELGKRLAEARRKKREERGVVVIDEKKEYKKDLTPYYKFGEIPTGYRPATMEEAIRNNEIGEYGRFIVDENVYYYYKKHTIMLNDSISDILLNSTLNGLKRRILKILDEIEIYKSKIDNDKYKDNIDENKQKLNEYKLSKKEVQGAYNYFLKEYAKRQNIPFVKASFKYIQPEVKTKQKVEYKVPQRKITIDPRTNKPVDNRTIDEDLYNIMINDKILTLNKKYFDNKKLKNKYALQLKKKNIIFREKYYNDDIIDEIFYKII
jgi:hypothetical protein